MINLEDCSFLIPIRLDSRDRLNNLNFIIRFLHSHFKTNILVYEEDKKPRYKKFKEDNINYKFIENQNKYFHRTKIINEMIKDANTEFVCIYDSDVFSDPKNYKWCVECLRSNIVDFIFPYDKPMVRVPRKYFEKLSEKFDLSIVRDQKLDVYEFIHYGACIFCNKYVMKDCGYYNERIISWGGEDDELFSRCEKMGAKFLRSCGTIYHMEHFRSYNSKPNDFYENNVKIFRNVKSMTESEVFEYIKGFEWANV